MKIKEGDHVVLVDVEVLGTEGYFKNFGMKLGDVFIVKQINTTEESNGVYVYSETNEEVMNEFLDFKEIELYGVTPNKLSKKLYPDYIEKEINGKILLVPNNENLFVGEKDDE